MKTAAWLIQEVIRTEQRLHENNMNDFTIKVHMTEKTKKYFLALSRVDIDPAEVNKLRGYDVIIGNTNKIEIVKEI